jgi:hypothetical protein
MSELGNALRKKYRTPKDALEALGIDQSLLANQENTMAKPTRIAAIAYRATAAAVAPLLAMDAKVSLPKTLFADLTSKNFRERKDALLSGVRGVVDGKLRAGLAMDASMKGLAKALDTFADLTEGGDLPATEDASAEIEAAAPIEAIEQEPASGIDALKAFLAEKGLSEEDILAAINLAPKAGATDEAETDKEKAAREKKEADDKVAKDNEMKDMVSKPAMDAALKAQSDTIRATERGIRVALNEVKPWVGELSPTLALDSATDVYRHAAVMLGVANAQKLHADALFPIIQNMPKPGAQRAAPKPALAMDAASGDRLKGLIPSLDKFAVGEA